MEVGEDSSEGEEYRSEAEEDDNESLGEADTIISSNEIQDLEEEMEQVVTMKTSTSIGKFVLPSIQYTWTDRKKQQRVSLDFLLPSGTSTNQVKVEVADCGRWLSLAFQPPDGFYDERRLLLANRNRGDAVQLNTSSHKFTAMAMAVENYRKQFANDEIVLTHREKLPFKCDTNLCTEELSKGCEIYPIANDDEEMRDQYNQHHMIYSVDLVSADKPKKTMVFAAMNLAAFGSPSELGENPDAVIAQQQRASIEASIMQQLQQQMEQQQQQQREQQQQQLQQQQLQQQMEQQQQRMSSNDRGSRGAGRSRYALPPETVSSSRMEAESGDQNQSGGNVPLATATLVNNNLVNG